MERDHRPGSGAGVSAWAGGFGASGAVRSWPPQAARASSIHRTSSREMAFFIGKYLLGRRRSAAGCLPLSIAQFRGKSCQKGYSLTPSTPEEEPAPEKPEEPPVPAEYLILDPTVMPEGGQRDGVTYAAYDGVVEHLFFHPVIAYPELAFDGDAQANGLDDFMVTVNEFNKILDSLYEKDYILVDIGDVWSETTGEDGAPKMVRNTLYIPEGKKPMVFSYDDTNYYPYMLENGFAHKLVLGEDGKVWSWGLDPQGQEVTSRDLDAIPILDKFVEEHPDFSPFGAKACLSLTGYEGILGYRTQTDGAVEWTEALEANRQREREAVKPIIEELRRTGWTFGSHTWGHIRLGSGNMAKIQADTQKWFDEVGSLVGETDILFYPHGERPDGGDWKQTGEAFKYLQGQGFRVFCSVGVESFSFIKKDICLAIRQDACENLP